VDEDLPAASAKHSQAPGPVTSLDDPRALQILSTEHWSLLSARSLAYNEAFTRGGMFLTFLSMSFVALALLSSAMAFGEQFLTIAAIVLGFDFVIGATTYGRIIGANEDDLRAVHGMARIRHAYTEIAPLVDRYFTAPTNDDIDSIVSSYGTRRGNDFLYAFTTSGGMIGLITAMIGGVLASVLALLFGASGDLAIWIGTGGAILVLAAIIRLSFGRVADTQGQLSTMFPAVRGEAPRE
jgi:phosphopantetheine adenylyltransferase